MSKIFLDEQGLALYDELIKAYIKKGNDQNLAAINVVASTAAQNQANIATLNGDENTAGSVAKAIKDAIIDVSDQVEANKDAIAVLNGDSETEGSVKKIAKEAVAEIVDNAPETLDTLKEIADWISSDETNAAQMLADIANNKTNIAANTQAINDLKSYVDSQDQAVLNSFSSIQDLEIKSLFMDKVSIEEGQTVSDAIANLSSNQMLVLDEDAEISEDFNVPEGVFIDANGATLSGNVTVAEGAEITNAVFTGTVTVG